MASTGTTIPPEAKGKSPFYPGQPVPVELFAGRWRQIDYILTRAAFWIDRDGYHRRRRRRPGHPRRSRGSREEVRRPAGAQGARGKDTKAILAKIAKTGLEMRFTRKEIAAGLTEDEKRKFGNFLQNQKMKRRGVIRPGDSTREWVFVMRMVRTFMRLDGVRSDAQVRSAPPS